MNKMTYDELIDRLKNTSPVLDNPEALTQSITAEINRLPVEVTKKRRSYSIAALSGIAACGLFCLLISEINRPVLGIPAKSTAGVVLQKERHSLNADYSVSEKRMFLSSIVKEKEENKEKKEALIRRRIERG